MKKINKTLSGNRWIKQAQLLLLLMFFLMPQLATAQSFTVDPAQTSSPTVEYIVAEDELEVALENLDGFTAGDKIYFYYVNTWQNQTHLNENRIIDVFDFPATSTPTTAELAGLINETGTFRLFAAHWTGRFDHETVLDNSHVAEALGTNSTDFTYLFNQAGVRRLTTHSFDFAGEAEGDVLLLPNLSGNVVENNAIIFEYSVDGGDNWESLDDGSDPAVDEFFGNLTPLNIELELPEAALTGNTKFRVRQNNSGNLPPGQQNFSIISMIIQKGTDMFLVPGAWAAVPFAGAQYTIIDPPVDPDPDPDPDDPAINTISISNADGVIAPGNPAIPGGTVTITLETEHLGWENDFDDYSFFIEIDEKIYPADNISAGTVTGTMFIVFDFPADIPQYYASSRPVKVIAVDGDEIEIIEGIPVIDDDIVLDDDGLVVSGGEVVGNEIEFNQSGLRQVTTSPFLISQHENTEIAFWIARVSLPQSNQVVVFEYSVDGTEWVQIGEDMLLGGPDGVGTGGAYFQFSGDDLPVAVVSPATQFRIRQLNDQNFAGEHVWKVWDFTLFVEGVTGDDNIVAESPTYNTQIDHPSFEIELADANEVLLPGSELSIIVKDIIGVFPEGTLFEVFYDDFWLKTLTELDNFSVNLPLDAGFKQIRVRPEVARPSTWITTNLEKSENFVIQNVGLTITQIEHHTQDSGEFYNIPGKEITVHFDLTGQLNIAGLNDPRIVMQIENPDGIWETIGIVPFEESFNTENGGIMNGLIPRNYEWDPSSTNVRLFIQSSRGDEWTHIVRRVAPVTIGNIRYFNFGNITQANALHPGSMIAFNLYLTGHEEGVAEMVYRTNWGPWQTIENGEIEIAGSEGFVTHYANIDDFFAAEELAGLFGSPVHLGIQFAGFSTSDLNMNAARIIQPLNQEHGLSNEYSINIIYPALTLETLAETNFIFGDEFQASYSSTYLDDETDLTYALVIEQNARSSDHVFHVLAESNEPNDLLEFVFPTREELLEAGFADNDPDIDFDVNLRMYVYVSDVHDVLYISKLEKEITLGKIADGGDFMEWQGYNPNYWWGGGIMGAFSLNEPRAATTRSLDLSEMHYPVTLHFTYQANIDENNINLQTLPMLMVSTDNGASFDTLAVGNAYSDYKRLPATGIHELSIILDEEYITPGTQFRWKQDVPIHAWTIRDVEIHSDPSNVVDFRIDFYPDPQQINIGEEPPPDDPYADFDNLNAYALTVEAAEPGFIPAVFAGEGFDFEWSIILDDNSEPVDIEWPEGTEFEFYIVLNDQSIPDDYVLFGTETSTGNFVGTIPEDVATEIYQVYVMAWIYEDGVRVHGVPGYVDYEVEDPVWNLPAVDKAELMVINEVTPDYYEIVLEAPTALNDDEDDPLFYFGGQMEIAYESFGPWADNIRFETVLTGVDDVNNDVYYNLGNQAQTGSVVLQVDIPTQAELGHFDLTQPMHLRIYAYCSSNGDEFIFAETVEFTLSDPVDHFLNVNNGANIPSLIFDGEELVNGVYTKRYAVTQSLAYYLGENTVLDNHMLRFSYNVIEDITPQTFQTIPRLQITTDSGVTYENLEWLFEDDTYEIELTQEHLDNAANIHFQWIQDFPAGAWELSQINFVSGESNWCDPQVASDKRDIDIIEWVPVYTDSFDNYELMLAENDDEDFDAPVYVDDLFTFSWLVVDDELMDEIWPEGTIFEFTLVDENGNTFVMALIDDVGTYSATLPGDLFITGVYDISVRAYIEGHTWPDINDPAIVKKTVFIINQISEDLRYLVVNTYAIFDVEEEVDIIFNKFGQWPAEVQFAAALEQFDIADNFIPGQRHILEQLGSQGSTITVKMPSLLILHDDFDKLKLRLYPFIGDVIDFGEPVDVAFAATKGDEVTPLRFDQVGDRWALTDALDLSHFESAQLEFDYWAFNIFENPGTLVRLEASTDGGETFEHLTIPTAISPFGDMGYLPANGYHPIIIDIEPQFLTEATHFRFKQLINNGQDMDVWEIANVGVSGDGNRYTDFLEDNNPQEVDLNQAKVANYEWIIEPVDGFEPVLYPGSSFNFTFEVELDNDGVPVGPAFPEGTEFEFFIKDYMADPFLMEVTVNDDGSYEYTLPDDIIRGEYEVLVHIVLNDIVIVDVGDDEVVGTINVFNPVLATQIVQEEVLYAGNTTSFTGELMNNVSGLNPEWYYNLVMIDNVDNEEWLLAFEQGLADFDDIAVPAFKSLREFEFEIRASIGSPLGTEGQLIEDAEEIKLLTWANGLLWGNQHAGQRFTVSNNEDLTEWPIIAFDVEVTTIDVTEAQSLVLEYSIDDGVSYNTISTYPNANFEFDGTSWHFSEMLELPESARTNVKLRFRIEELMEEFTISDARLITYLDYSPAPMTYDSDEIFIAQQRIDITGTDALAYCNTGVVELSYQIRGSFGVDNVMTVRSNAGPIFIDGEPLTFTGITHGSGTVSIDLGMLDTPLSGSNVRFRLDADDQTVADYGYTVLGTLSEVPVEIIPIIPSTALSAQLVGLSNHISCADHERKVIIHNVLEGFSYQLRNFVTGADIGDAVVADPDDDDLTNADTYPWYDTANNRLHISIGTVEQLTKVEVLITAQDSSGELVCQVEIPNEQVTFDVRPLYSLYYSWNGSGWTLATDGQEFVICDGSGQLSLTMGYYKSGDFYMIPNNALWYRDDLSMPVANDRQLNNFVATGSYFAIYNDGVCGEYQTVEVSVTVNEKPDQPAITVNGETVSNFEICHGETVVLEATEGFAYYRWTLNGTTVFGNNQSITAGEAGMYRVEVSNVPPGQNCWSDWSTPVNVIVNDINDVWFATNDIYLCHDGDFVAEVTVGNLMLDVTYTLVNNLTDEVVAEFSSTNNQVTFLTEPITETSQFSVHAVHEVNGCTKMVSGDVVLNVHVLEEYHILAYNGTFFEPAEGSTFCEGTDLAVGMEDGTIAGLPGSVKWYRNNLLVSTGFTVNTNTYGAGVYHARWMLDDNCYYNTGEVTIGGKPNRPALTYQGSLEFCEGEGDLILIAPAGFAGYKWFKDGLLISGVESTSNELQVVETGAYRVHVINDLGCESEPSLAVDAIVHSKPLIPIATAINDVLCAPGMVGVMIANPESDVRYQLYNIMTGEPTGQARMGQAGLVLQSGVIDQHALLEVRASRLGVQACASVSAPMAIHVYDLQIMVSGNTLMASIAPYDPVGNPKGAISYQWYRNGNMIVMGGSGRMLSIYDDAEYSLIVTTATDCILEASIIVDSSGVIPGEEEVITEMIIYPNPAKEEITVRYDSAVDETLHIKILSIRGEIVFDVYLEKTVGEIEYTIPIFEYKDGIYLLHVVGQDDVKVQQFIKF